MNTFAQSDRKRIKGKRNDSFFRDDLDEREVIRLHRRSFNLVFRLLPRAVRHDVRRLIAWFVCCEQAVDKSPDSADAIHRLGLLRRDLSLIDQGEAPRLAPSRWIEELIERHNIPIEWPSNVIKGIKSKLSFDFFENQDDLEVHCSQTGGTLGKMLCHILGVQDTDALDKANHMGVAMQMISIAGAVNQDWKRERCFLPLNWLGETPNFRQQDSPAKEFVQPAVKRILQIAANHYKGGIDGLSIFPNSGRLAYRVVTAVYRQVHREILADHCRVIGKQYSVNIGQKFLISLREVGHELAFRFKRLLGTKKSKVHFDAEKRIEVHNETGN